MTARLGWFAGAGLVQDEAYALDMAARVAEGFRRCASAVMKFRPATGRRFSLPPTALGQQNFPSLQIQKLHADYADFTPNDHF